MSEIELFVQGEGVSGHQIVTISADVTVRDIARAAIALGLPPNIVEEVSIFLEESETPLDHTLKLEHAGVRNESRVHLHRCKVITVTVNFNAQQKVLRLAPARTVGAVKAIAAREFGLSEVDAAEHVLQICASHERPEPSTQIGSLSAFPGCTLCFDLVPLIRVEG